MLANAGTLPSSRFKQDKVRSWRKRERQLVLALDPCWRQVIGEKRHFRWLKKDEVNHLSWEGARSIRCSEDGAEFRLGLKR